MPRRAQLKTSTRIPADVPPGRLLHTIPGTVDSLGVSRSYVYALIAAGKLEVRKIGARTLITDESLRAFVRGLPRV